MANKDFADPIVYKDATAGAGFACAVTALIFSVVQMCIYIVADKTNEVLPVA
jgi:hypothetical protein